MYNYITICMRHNLSQSGIHVHAHCDNCTRKTGMHDIQASCSQKQESTILKTYGGHEL